MEEHLDEKIIAKHYVIPIANMSWENPYSRNEVSMALPIMFYVASTMKT